MISLRLLCRDSKASISYLSGRWRRQNVTSQWVIARNSFTRFSISQIVSPSRTRRICLSLQIWDRIPVLTDQATHAYRAAKASARCRNTGSLARWMGGDFDLPMPREKYLRWVLFRQRCDPFHYTVGKVYEPKSYCSESDRRTADQQRRLRRLSHRSRDTPWLFHSRPCCTSGGSAANSGSTLSSDLTNCFQG
jgi:hypothetical protein